MVVLIVDCNNKRGNMRNRAKIGKNLTCVHSKLDQSWRWGVRADGRPSGGWICSSTARGGLRLYQGWSPYRRRMATTANAQAATLEASVSLLHTSGLPSEGWVCSTTARGGARCTRAGPHAYAVGPRRPAQAYHTGGGRVGSRHGGDGRLEERPLWVGQW
jgi:hypothetical protein